jgi:hypothetical protein
LWQATFCGFGEVEKRRSQTREHFLAKLKSFKFADFLQIFGTQGFFPAKCKTAKSQFPESAKSSFAKLKSFALWPIFIASKLLTKNDDFFSAHRLPN